MKTYIASDLGFHETYKGEPIVRCIEFKGKIYLFTPNNTYVVRKKMWYDPVVNFFKRLAGK